MFALTLKQFLLQVEISFPFSFIGEEKGWSVVGIRRVERGLCFLTSHSAAFKSPGKAYCSLLANIVEVCNSNAEVLQAVFYVDLWVTSGCWLSSMISIVTHLYYCLHCSILMRPPKLGYFELYLSSGWSLIYVLHRGLGFLPRIWGTHKNVKFFNL